jgi:arylsulfatase A-like enzyme
VPLIIAPPQAEHAGAKADAPVELLDIYPTLVGL